MLPEAAIGGRERTIYHHGGSIGRRRISPQILGSEEVAQEPGRSGGGPTQSPNGCQGQRERSPHQAREGVVGSAQGGTVMDESETWIGIDVAKGWLDVAE